MSENWFRYGAFPPNHRPLTCSALLSSMLKSNCKVLTLPVQRKQTPYASCPVVRKSFLSWYLYYDHDFRKYQFVFLILFTSALYLLQFSQTGNHYPILLEAGSNLIWIAGFQFDSSILSNIYLIGPTLSGRDTHLILRKKLDSYELSAKLSRSVHKIFESIPAISSNILIQYAVILHYCLNHEKNKYA